MVTFSLVAVWNVTMLPSHTEKPVIRRRSFSLNKATNRSKLATEKVCFLVAGVQKGGTTALFEYLTRHPYLSLSLKKEVHFFDNEEIDWKAPNYADYESPQNFQKKTNIRGEATPIYIYWRNSLERIKAYNPDMKLIFVFRQPVERAWSNWRMQVERGVEKKSFSWAIRIGTRRVANASDLSKYHRTYSYVERGYYGKQLEKVLQLFSRDQLLLLLSEDLRANPTKIMKQISTFLQVPASAKQIKQLTAHKTPQDKTHAVLEEEDVKYLQKLYKDDLKLFARLSGLNITSWFF